MTRMLLLFLLISHFTWANDKTLSVALNVGAPWAYYQQDKGVVGIDVDIIKQVLNGLGYQPEFYLLTYQRLIKDFNQGKYDIASPAAFDTNEGHRTQTYLPFQDVAVTLANRELSINEYSDLAGKIIVAYEHARAVLGETFTAAVTGERYTEIAEREIQLKLLADNKTDVVIGERLLLTTIMKNLYPQLELAVHPIFEKKSYGAIVRDKTLQQQFDERLATMRADGSLTAILERWNATQD
ncbi:transporter substrate-binding domain-containing protein [Aestuariibacter salexigens]|uniref:transporter substrate-binding domain-containing protein n=1 Tax=Aestuariibacter salexigens TaxID=226010 RepID=UPI000402F9F5|nr:transporter substrate-binding domain-containing protein [Aestuariibacter salexigens]